MTINYHFKKDNLEQGEPTWEKELIRISTWVTGGAKLSFLLWSTVTGGKKGCEKGSFPQMPQHQVFAHG